MRAASNRLQWMLIGTSVLAVSAAWLFTYRNILEDREITRSTSVRIVDSLAVSLEEHFGATLRDARNAVYSAAVIIENTGGFGGFKSTESLHKNLNRELHDNASTARLIAVDGRGRVVASSSEYPLPDVSSAKDESFAWHASNPAERSFHLGVVHKSAIGGKMVIPYSRAVFDRSGGVAGAVVAELSAEYLARLYATLTGTINASIVVFNHDGIILMRVPYDESILGRGATSPAEFKKMLVASGNTEFTSKWDGKTRYYSHRVMKHPPVLVAVGVDRDEVMAPSATRTRHRVALIGVATVAFLALVWLLAADLRRLARSEERLRESEARLRLAVHVSNIGLWDWDIAADHVYYSPEWKSQLGYRQDDIPARFEEWESRLHPEDRARALLELKAYLASPVGGHEVEIRLRHKDGSYRWIYSRAQVEGDGTGRVRRMLGCHVDITERKRAEEAREALLRRNQSLVAALGEIVYEWRPGTDELIWEGDYTKLLGYSTAEMGSTTESWTSRVHPDDLERVLAEVDQCTRKRRNYDLEYRFRHRDGTYVWMHDRGVTFVSPEGTLVRIIGIFVDITERKRGEEELQQSFSRLQELSRRLADTEEAERRNISRELHDRVGQNLSALNLNLGIIRTQITGGLPATLETRLDDAQRLLEATSQQVRNVMAELRPAALDDYGLLAALRNHAAAVAARLGIVVTVEGKDPDPRLPLTTETALFRIAQEALNNVAKHAQARTVEVRVSAGPHSLNLAIADDGIGFDATRKSQGMATYGLVTMRERAEAIGAHLRIESAPGKGTRVEVEMAKAFP